jgi:Mg-chelatase subunit ChlD
MSFAAELTRATAQRGRLDPIYQELSDDWTLILQQFFPVWALIGPGLAEPGHIVLRSRTVYLDSEELLGNRARILAGQLERRAILRTYGVAIHEVFHAKHTKLWVTERDVELSSSEDTAERQLAADRELLEEPRMEAHGCREFAQTSARGRFVRLALEAAVLDCIVPRFVEQFAAAVMAGHPVTRDMAGRAITYLHARTHYGVVNAAALAHLHGIWQQVLGRQDVKALDDLYAQLIWVPDGENELLSRWAQRYRDIIGPPDPAASADDARGQDVGRGGRASQPGEQPEPGEGQGSADGVDGRPDVGSLKDALEKALKHGRANQLEQLNEDVDLAAVLEQAATRGQPSAARKGAGTGAPTGRIPDRGVDRPPFPDEVQEARKLAQRLLRARKIGVRRIDKPTPGGRFNGRAYARGRFERASGRPVTSHPWTITREITAPLQEPHVLLVVDTSGSMGAYEYALGPIVWIVTTAFRQIGGKVATVLFGNAAALMSDGTDPMAKVPAIQVGGGTAFAGDAIVMGCAQLEMDNQRRPRAVYVISDGGWYDTEAGVHKIRWLAELAVPTIHLSIGAEPLSVEASRVCVLTDPAEGLDVIAEDAVQALTARHRRRPAPGLTA